MDRCITYIGENAAECVKSQAFVNLSKDGLIKLISSDYFCLEEEDVWRCVLAWAKHQAGVAQPTAHWTEDERAQVCQYLAGVMGHVRLLLIDSQVFAEEVEPTGAVPMELSLERYRHAALQTSKAANAQQHMAHLSGAAHAMSLAGHQQHPGAAHQTVHHQHQRSITSSPPPLPALPSGNSADKRLQPRQLHNMFPGSGILRSDRLHLQSSLNGWFGVPKQTWRQLYRASVHGFAAAAFHARCDGVAPTFVLVLGARGEISGGFSDAPWSKTSQKGGYIHSERAFLFALGRADGGQSTAPVKYDIVKKPYAICYHADCGPIFGAGADLLISNNCNANTDSYSNLPHSYDGPAASCSSLLGDYNFLVSDYEVYTTAGAALAAAGGAPPPPPTGAKAKSDRF